MRLILYLGLAAVGFATLALCFDGQRVDGQIEELSLRLAQKPDGRILGVLNNSSKGDVTMWVLPFSVEVLKGDTWTTLRPEVLSCATIGSQKYEIPAGRQIEFWIDGWLDLLKDGDTLRASVAARSGFNGGQAVSNAIKFSQTR